MSKVIAYKNNERYSFCHIRFDSKEKVLISFATTPAPSFKIIKLLFGIVPIQTIWEFGLPFDGQNSHDKLIALLAGEKRDSVHHPLDAAIVRLSSCRSCAEAVMALKEVELKAE